VAHDYLGTFNKSQFERFLTFARSQVAFLPQQIAHLESEIARSGQLIFTFGVDGIPTQLQATEGSYLAKLLAAYEVLGGDPYLDLRARDKDTQSVFVVKARQGSSAQYASNGEPLAGRALLDAPSAELMRALRAPLEDQLAYRFLNLERKIRRTLDYVDNLKSEVVRLKVYLLAGTENGSLENIAQKIYGLLSDGQYRAIYDDGGTDPIGLNAYAPFSLYDSSGTKPSASPQRQSSGFSGPNGRS
jgi:hypothetical protein